MIVNPQHNIISRLISMNFHYQFSAHNSCSTCLVSVSILWAAFHEKVPNVLSRCHTKRRAGAAPRARPSFGMTTTQDIRDLFA